MNHALEALLNWLFDEDPIAAQDVEDRTRLLLLDTVGCYIAGQDKPAVQQIAERYTALDQGSILLPGLETPVSTSTATFLIATGACWDEACEGLARAHGRPGLHAIPPALAIGLAQNQDLGALLRAIVTGYEVGGRMGEALRILPGMHVDGSWGALGAAAAAARALGGDAQTCVTAIETVACQIPFSLYSPVASGKTARNTYPGHGAVLGLLAGISANSTVDSPPGALDDYLRIALRSSEDGTKLAPPGEYYLLEGYLKPHAAVRHVHYGAECAMAWRTQHGADTESISKIVLKIYDEAQRYCGNRAPKSAIQAQFSLTHGLARALVAGDLGPATYTAEAMNDPEIVRLEALIELETDADLTAAEARGATLTVDCAGAQSSVSVTSIPGDPDRPISADETQLKFMYYTTPIIGASKAERLADAILDDSKEAPLRDIFGSG